MGELSEQDRDTLFCLRLFSLLSLGGLWVVPRSGLVFEKVSLDPPTLLLKESLILPTPGAKAQVADFLLIQEKFAAAEIQVVAEHGG